MFFYNKLFNNYYFLAYFILVIFVLNYISNYNPILLAFCGGIFSFIITSLGSGIVFLFKRFKKDFMNAMMAISAGIMFSASFFSLINPAIEMCSKYKQNFFLTIVFGFVAGGLFIYISNKVIDKIKFNKYKGLKGSILLFSSITLHNIPEGIAIGVAFGNIIYGGSLIAALSLTMGIAIQNFPEGAAISLPLIRNKVSPRNAFILGSISGIVEPIFSLIGAILVLKINYILTFILSFAASAMIFVTVFELIPESQSSEKKDLMALIFIFGFIFMMILDVLLD